MTQFCWIKYFLFKYFLDCGHMCAVLSSLINWAESVVTGKTLIHTGSHDTPLFTQSLTKLNIYQIKQCNSSCQYYSSQRGIILSIFWCSKTLFLFAVRKCSSWSLSVAPGHHCTVATLLATAADLQRSGNIFSFSWKVSTVDQISESHVQEVIEDPYPVTRLISRL